MTPLLAAIIQDAPEKVPKSFAILLCWRGVYGFDETPLPLDAPLLSLSLANASTDSY
jgi:hypothetical protein